jgi:hypothetical protein
MARYPEVSTFIMVDLSNEESRTVYNEMQLWSGALINELDTRDIEVDAAPSTTVLSVVTVTDIGAPIAGNIAFSTGESTFKGYDGTNWQDLH